MKTLVKTTLLAAILLPGVTNIAKAQDSTRSSGSGDLKSVITGDFFYGFKFVNNKGLPGKPNTSTFNTAGYNPVILYKLSDKLFFEGELEFQTSANQEDPAATSGNAVGEGMKVEMEFANMGYVVNKYMMVRAGIMFTPYGVFEDWYHQRITNRMVSRPIGIGHGGIEPGADEGIAINGGFPLGHGAKLHYAIAILNGAKLITNDPANNNGSLEYESIIDNNVDKAVVGRIGFLPVSWLEIGGWYGTQRVGADNDKLNSNVRAVHSGAYFSIMKDIDQIKGSVCLRSQYSILAVGDATFAESDTLHAPTYIFKNNNSSAYYAQLSYRPTMVASKFARKCEIAARYGSMTLPDQAQGKWILPSTSAATKSKNQVAVSIDYWFKWNAVIKFAYEQNYGVADSKGIVPALPRASYLVQIAMGL